MNRVSVVIPTRDRGALLRRAVESGLNQTYPDVEVIVVDDGSRSRVEDDLGDLAGRVRLLRHTTPLGASAARNAGVRLATGSLLAFLDDDDWWPPALLEGLASRVEPGVVVCYDNEIVELNAENGERPVASGRTVFSEFPGWRLHSLERRTMHRIFDGAPMFKTVVHRDDFARVGGFDRRFAVAEDFHFCVKLLAAGAKLRIVREPRGFYTINPDSVTNRIRNASRADYAARSKGIESWLSVLETLPRELPLTSQARAACRRNRRYWRARRAEALIVSTFGHRRSGVARGRAALAIGRALPHLALLESRKVARALRGGGDAQ